METITNNITKNTVGKEKNRVIYFDVLNIIAIISVIALHCNGIVHSNPDIKAWDTSLIVECVCYFAVPVFACYQEQLL